MLSSLRLSKQAGRPTIHAPRKDDKKKLVFRPFAMTTEGSLAAAGMQSAGWISAGSCRGGGGGGRERYRQPAAACSLQQQSRSTSTDSECTPSGSVRRELARNGSAATWQQKLHQAGRKPSNRSHTQRSLETALDPQCISNAYAIPRPCTPAFAVVRPRRSERSPRERLFILLPFSVGYTTHQGWPQIWGHAQLESELYSHWRALPPSWMLGGWPASAATSTGSVFVSAAHIRTTWISRTTMARWRWRWPRYVLYSPGMKDGWLVGWRWPGLIVRPIYTASLASAYCADSTCQCCDRIRSEFSSPCLLPPPSCRMRTEIRSSPTQEPRRPRAANTKLVSVHPATRLSIRSQPWPGAQYGI